MMIWSSAEFFLGSARASRAGFGATPKQSFGEKVRDGGGAIASTRGACAPQNLLPIAIWKR
jgi:hypothetical protein